MADFYRARAAELHTQDGHAACGGNCQVAQLLVMLDESRTIALEEGARASAAQATATTLRAALTACAEALGEAREVDKALVELWTLLPEGSWEDAPFSTLALAGHALHMALNKPTEGQAPVAAPGGEG